VAFKDSEQRQQQGGSIPPRPAKQARPASPLLLVLVRLLARQAAKDAYACGDAKPVADAHLELSPSRSE
jgi:hypothetical protein